MAGAHEVHSECPPSLWLIIKLPGWFTFRAHSLIDLAVTSIQLGDTCDQIEMNPSKFDQEIDQQIVRIVQL